MMEALDKLIREKCGHWGMMSAADMPSFEGFDAVESVRKTRDMHYKMENGLPYAEEKKYLDDMKRSCDKQWKAHLKMLKERNKKELAFA